MAPLIPRFHVFEIDDQPWFPSFLRVRVQDALTETWIAKIPGILPVSAASRVATLLRLHLGPSLSSYTYVDFCAGAGGPTPYIERSLNRSLRASAQPPVDFVLTDLHPNPEAWSRAAAKSDHLRYEESPVDASDADAAVLARLAAGGLSGSRDKKVFRLFNLAFHHFDDHLASAILKNTLETSDGFAIFELQGRDLHSFFICLILGLGTLLAAPLFAWRHRSWVVIVFTYLIPILPFVLTFDGWMSSLRTRTADEVKLLMDECGADSTGWEIKSGSKCHLWPGYLNYIIATKKTKS